MATADIITYTGRTIQQHKGDIAMVNGTEKQITKSQLMAGLKAAGLESGVFIVWCPVLRCYEVTVESEDVPGMPQNQTTIFRRRAYNRGHALKQVIEMVCQAISEAYQTDHIHQALGQIPGPY